MIYKEKLAGGGGNSLDPSHYTHIVSVASWSNFVSSSNYGFNTSNGGNIEPKTVTVNGVALTIGALSNFPRSTTYRLSLAFSSQVTTSGTLYIGRYDKLLKITVQLNENTEIYNVTHTSPLFSPSDVGKDISIWLSTTPPPWKDGNDHSGGVTGG